MKNINNMSKSIYNYPEQYAQDIVSSFDLTLPIDLSKICEELDIKGKKVTLVLIKELADQYEVSLVVMARRVLEYTESEAVVLIYYPNGNKYIQKKSKTFKEEIKDGRITKSSAHKLLTSYNTSAEIKDILESSIWFDQKEDSYSIGEESMFQNSLGRVFTLLRTADDGDELDLVWNF